MSRTVCACLVAIALPMFVPVGHAHAAIPSPPFSGVVAPFPGFGGGGGLNAQFRLRGSNGYAISVVASHGGVSLVAWKGQSQVDYEAAARISTDRLRAKLGSLGGISVHFQASRKVRFHSPPPNCRGSEAVTRFGTFSGTIRLRGETGFTRVFARHARGTFSRRPKWRCRHPRGVTHGSGEARQKAPTMLVEQPLGDVSFSASIHSLPEVGRQADFYAGKLSHAGGVVVDSVTWVKAAPDSFVFDNALTSAIISPPPPFSGTAVFQRSSDFETSWVGDLTVTLPGVGRVPLTGRDFVWSLVLMPTN